MHQSYFLSLAQRCRLLCYTVAGIGSFIALVLMANAGQILYQTVWRPAVIQTASDIAEASKYEGFSVITVQSYTDKDIKHVSENSESMNTYHYISTNIDDTPIWVSMDDTAYNKLKSQSAGPYVFTGKLVATPNGVYLSCKSPWDKATPPLVYCVVFLILFLYKVAPIVIRNRQALQSLRKYAGNDFKDMIQQIDTELAKPNVFQRRNIIITENFLVIKSMTLVMAFPICELAWVYEGSYQYGILGIIPLYEGYQLFLHFSDEQTYEIGMGWFKSNKFSQEVLDYIETHYDHVIVGYSDDLNTSWLFETQDFINDWRERRRSNQI